MAPVHVLWDFHSVPLPSSVSLSFACSRLQSLGSSYGRLSSFGLLAAEGRLDEGERAVVQASGGEVAEWRSDKEEAAASSLFLLTRLCHLALSLSRSPSPSPAQRAILVVLSGDVDLSHALSLLRQSGLFSELVLVHPQGAADSLRSCATLSAEWLQCLGVSAAADSGDSPRGHADAKGLRAEGEAGADVARASLTHSRRSSDSLGERGGGGERGTTESMAEEKTASEDAAGESLRISSSSVGEGFTHPPAVSDELERMANSVAKMGLTASPTTRPLSPSSLPHPHQRAPPHLDAFHSSSFPAATQWEQLSSTAAAFSPKAAHTGYASTAGYQSPSLPVISSAEQPRTLHFSDPEFGYSDAQRLLLYHQQQQQQHMTGFPSHPPRFYPSTAQTAPSRQRKLSSTQLPLLVQPGIPQPVQPSASMRGSDRASPRHRQFIAVFHRVLAYCEQEKIIPRESVVKKRLLDSKLSMDVDFEEFLAVVEDSGCAVIEGEAPQRVIWPRAGGEGGGARRFACADFFQPSQRLSSEQTQELLSFLAQVQPTIDRGRFGFAQWLARHGPKFIQLLPHGVLVELVQLLLNQKVLLFRKGKVSVSPQLNTDPALFFHAIHSAQGAEGGGSGATVSGPTTPPHTPPSQPQWPTSSSASFSHSQQHTHTSPMPYSHPHSQPQLYPSMYAQQQQQTPPAMRGWSVRPMTGGMVEGGGSQYGEFDDDDYVPRGMDGGSFDASERLTSSEGSRSRSKEAVRERTHRPYKTWAHPSAFVPQLPQMAPPPNQSSAASSTASSTQPLSSPSQPSSASSTPLAPIGRPRMMSMPPQIPRPPSTLAGQMTPPAREAAASIPLVSPKAGEKSSGGQPPQSDPAVGGALQLGVQSTPSRTSSSASTPFNGGGSGAASRKTTPHTSPVLAAQQAPSFSTRPSSPFEFGLPLTAVDSGVFSAALPPVPPAAAAGSRLDSRLRAVRSLNISSPPSGHGSPMSHTASLSILSSLASTTSPSVPVTPNSTSFFSSHSPMSQAGSSQPNSADSGLSACGRTYGDEGGAEGRPRSVSNPVEPYQPPPSGSVGSSFPSGLLGSGGARRGLPSSHQRHHSTSANAQSYEVAQHQQQRERELQQRTEHAQHAHQQQHAKADFEHRQAAHHQQQQLQL